jgi:hypothetical protein
MGVSRRRVNSGGTGCGASAQRVVRFANALVALLNGLLFGELRLKPGHSLEAPHALSGPIAIAPDRPTRAQTPFVARTEQVGRCQHRLDDSGDAATGRDRGGLTITRAPAASAEAFLDGSSDGGQWRVRRGTAYPARQSARAYEPRLDSGLTPVGQPRGSNVTVDTAAELSAGRSRLARDSPHHQRPRHKHAPLQHTRSPRASPSAQRLSTDSPRMEAGSQLVDGRGDRRVVVHRHLTERTTAGQ